MSIVISLLIVVAAECIIYGWMFWDRRRQDRKWKRFLLEDLRFWSDVYGAPARIEKSMQKVREREDLPEEMITARLQGMSQARQFVFDQIDQINREIAYEEKEQ
jgi:hypothetical protein